MTMTNERDRGGARMRFGILHLGMLAGGVAMREGADPNVCFATSAMPRAEGEEEKPEGGEGAKGIDIPTKCATCSVENDKDAHFCKGCGKSMATTATEEPAPKPKEARVAAPAKMSADASLASILGASGDSPLALRTAAINLRQIRDTAIGVTGQTAPGAIVGALLTMPERLAQADLAAETERKRAVTAEHTARRDLASRLNKLDLAGWPRDAIFADRIDDGTGKPMSPPPMTKTIAAWDLAEFRGYVEGFEKKTKARGPFEASRDRAQAGATEHGSREGAQIVSGTVPTLPADGEPTAAQIEAAKRDPMVIKIFGNAQQSGNVAATLDAIARQHVKTCAAHGLPIGGAS